MCVCDQGVLLDCYNSNINEISTIQVRDNTQLGVHYKILMEENNHLTGSIKIMVIFVSYDSLNLVFCTDLERK